MKISKNFSVGEPIIHLSEINNLAKEKKSVVIERNGFRYLKAAAFIQNWSLHECTKWNFYHSIKDI